MEDSAGVKFTPKLTKKGVKQPITKELASAGRRLADEGLVFGSAGNLSAKIAKGFVVTCADAELDKLAPDDFAIVTDCNLKSKTVFAQGKKVPSSESVLHHLIYKTNPHAKAVVHAHSGVFLNDSKVQAMGVPTTDVFIEYGTLDLAYNVAKTIGRGDFLIIKGHGAVAVGASVAEAAAVMIQKYRELKGMSVRVDPKFALAKSTSMMTLQDEMEEEAAHPKKRDAEKFEKETGASVTGAQGHRGTEDTDETEEDDLPEWVTEERKQAEGADGSLELEETREEAQGEEEIILESEEDAAEEDAPVKKSKSSSKAAKKGKGKIAGFEEVGLKPKPAEKQSKFSLFGFLSSGACPSCGEKKRFGTKSCKYCGYCFALDTLSHGTSNLIKFERKSRHGKE